MHDLLRERIMRKLAVLSEAQVYQVLDYIEFLESKYAPGRAAKPDGLQRFAERLEDGMRIRKVAPAVISGTVNIVGTARKVIQGVSEAGKEIGRTILGEGEPANGSGKPASLPPAAKPTERA
jgi:hypothetical protein